MSAIRVCINPHCEAIMHNCSPAHTRCPDCDTYAVAINYDLFFKKYRNHYFQYNMNTGEIFRFPAQPNKKQLALSL